MESYEILDVEDILELHDMLISDFGGMSGVFPDTEAKVDSIVFLMGIKELLLIAVKFFYILMGAN